MEFLEETVIPVGSGQDYSKHQESLVLVLKQFCMMQWLQECCQNPAMKKLKITTIKSITYIT